MPHAYEIIVLLQTVLYCCMLLLLTVPKRMVAVPFTTTPLRYSSLCSKKVFHTLLEEFIRFLFVFFFARFLDISCAKNCEYMYQSPSFSVRSILFNLMYFLNIVNKIVDKTVCLCRNNWCWRG